LLVPQALSLVLIRSNGIANMKITLKHAWMVPHIVKMNDGRTIQLETKETEVTDADAVEILDKHAPLFEEVQVEEKVEEKVVDQSSE